MDFIITPEVATLTSGLIGGTVGSLGNYFIQKSIEESQKESETATLRSSLISEMETMNHIDDFDIGPRNIPSKDNFRREVYENSGSKLGLLSKDEAVAVIHFYGAMGNLQGEISEFTSARRQKREIEQGRHAANKQAQSEVSKRYSLIEDSFKEMRKHRRAALHLLSGHS